MLLIYKSACEHNVLRVLPTLAKQGGPRPAWIFLRPV